ncbi:amidohydrolase family protein [Pseudomonas capeferrum]|uniref:amidohydrolase family protein n=1 Tax=Pseudomonas capeferrum TaxID=1495066 RepID=UPI0015E2BE7B|nr:amidohydrolase family protein [Pseudomonas capeferrum]MBA1204223.1 amidohydrolase family protein [Pseudomonas capeferrum]
MLVENGFARRTLLKLGSMIGAGLVLPAMAAESGTPPRRERGRTLIRHATIISMDSAIGDLVDADVLIDEERIKAVGREIDPTGAEVLDARGMIMIPGLIDGHWHLWNSLLRSSAPRPGGEAFFKTQLATSKRFTAQLTELGVRLGLVEAIHAGITTVNSWSHNLRSPEFAQAELRALKASGLRARLWYGYAQDLPAGSAMDFKDIERVQGQLRDSAYERIDLGLAIRGPERTEAAIWQDEFAFANARKLPLSMHIAVSREMQEKKAIQQLAERGVLGPSVQLVHATHADEHDLRSISGSGASVCLTPLTEMRVGYGLAPVAALHGAKIPVSLGIDTLVLSGNANPYMLMQTSLNLAIGMTGDEQRMSARDVLHWATQGAADTMGLGRVIGSITPGKRADLVLIDARQLGMFPVADPVASVVQSASPAHVDTVFADGVMLKRGGRVLGVDMARLGEAAAAGLEGLRG